MSTIAIFGGVSKMTVNLYIAGIIGNLFSQTFMEASCGWCYIWLVYMTNTLQKGLMVPQYNVSIVVPFVSGKFITDPNAVTYTISNACLQDTSVKSINIKTNDTCRSRILNNTRYSKPVQIFHILFFCRTGNTVTLKLNVAKFLCVCVCVCVCVCDVLVFMGVLWE